MPGDDAPTGGEVPASPPGAGAVLVIVPTYNERDNLDAILDRLFAASPGVDVLVVDDASPDGTGDIADARAAADGRVHVLHRTAKQGLGAAYRAAFRWGLERGYDVLVEMDADGSHPPEALTRLLAALGHADLVIGSRYVPGGAVANWPLHRQLLSRGANLYARIALGGHVRDMTAGFRAYRAQVLRTLPLDRVASQGYCFQVDLTWRTLEGRFRVVEVPITFTERELGVSKMDGSIMAEAFTKIAAWGARRRWRQLTGLLGARPRS